jgi:hypothetical protein
MTKELIIQRLQDTIAQLEQLPAAQFNFDLYVTNLDEQNHCNSICCIAGWYPIWFPEVGLMYKSAPTTIQPVNNVNSIRKTLSSYHSIHFELIDIFFYSSLIDGPLDYLRKGIDTNSLRSIIEVWKRVVCEIKKNKLDRYLFLTDNDNDQENNS